MNRPEMAKVLAMLAAAYPTFDVDKLKLELWMKMLGDLEPDKMNRMIMAHIATERFAPSISEIREKLTPKLTDAVDAWGVVADAVKNIGLYRDEDAMGYIEREAGPVAVEVVKAIGWRELNMAHAFDGVVRGQFLRMYEVKRKEAQYEAMLPDGLRKALASGQQLFLPEGDDDD